MDLGKIFQEKAEKIEEEKKLEIIVTKEAKAQEFVAVTNFIVTYFDDFCRTLPLKMAELWGRLGLKAYLYNNQYTPIENFNTFKDYFKNVEITPKIINQVNKQLPKEGGRQYNANKGVFFSALIQTSYNQGFNNFEFKEISTCDFGAWLRGKEGKPIIVKAEKIEGANIFHNASNCSLTADTVDGLGTFWYAEKCSLIAKRVVGENIFDYTTNCFLEAETIQGDFSLGAAENCVAEIANYKGRNFGEGMKNCTIYSPNQEVLDKIEKQTWPHTKTNTYLQGKKPQWV
ncbi:hypothetical protein HY643_05160 [Candidatus Woesearchaeota archaeon]|nr:hypothetical protein [Candidatus Woesearchaeota archaeon]